MRYERSIWELVLNLGEVKKYLLLCIFAGSGLVSTGVDLVLAPRWLLFYRHPLILLLCSSSVEV